MKLIWPRNRATVTLDQIKENSPTKKNRKKLNIDFLAQARRGLRLKICFDLNLNSWRILNNWIINES